jgi:aspartyl protease family protein
MDSFDYGRIGYLVLLGTVVGSYFLIENRHRLGKVFQQAIIWGLIFIGVVAAIGLWDDISRDVAPRESVMSDGSIEVPMAPDGHYYMSAIVDGVSLRFVVDTGASDIVLTGADAAKLGYNPMTMAYTGQARTANGAVATAPISIRSLEMAGFRDEGIRAVVNSGDLDTSLLGMSYLSKFHITLSGETMTLMR